MMIRRSRRVTQLEHGFTLIEVLASIVIISVILLGVIQLIGLTNKTAVSNNTKLVTINLARTTMERIKLQPENYFEIDSLNFGSGTIYTYDRHYCIPVD